MTITTGAALSSDGDNEEPSDALQTTGAADAAAGIAVAVAPTAAPIVARPALGDRLRGAVPFAGPGLTSLGGVVLAIVVVGLGVGLDLAVGDSLGLAFDATFLLAAALVAIALRVRALATAVVLPPLLFVGAQVLSSKAGGHTAGARETALDVGTSLALSAPLLFAGTALAVAVVLARVVVRLIRG